MRISARQLGQIGTGLVGAGFQIFHLGTQRVAFLQGLRGLQSRSGAGILGGLANAGSLQLDFQPFTREALYEAEDRSDDEFLGFANAWIELAAMLNELSRSMGQPDFYPFALPAPVIAKLHFIHKVIHSAQPSVLEQRLAADDTAAGATLGATV